MLLLWINSLTSCGTKTKVGQNTKLLFGKYLFSNLGSLQSIISPCNLLQTPIFTCQNQTFICLNMGFHKKVAYSSLQNILLHRQRCQREPNSFESSPANYLNNAFGDEVSENSRNRMVKLCAKPNSQCYRLVHERGRTQSKFLLFFYA